MNTFSFPDLNYLRLRFILKAQDNCLLPAWKGSLLRGAFGHALRRTVCTMKKGQDCQSCLLCSKCAYTCLFETFITRMPPPRFFKGQQQTPRPFILEPGDTKKIYQINDTLWFDLILIGDATNYLPYIIFSVYQLAGQGLGVRRYPFQLISAYCYQPQNTNDVQMIPTDSNYLHVQKCPDWKQVYDGDSQSILFSPYPINIKLSNTTKTISDALTINFITQTRLMEKGKLLSDFTFRTLAFRLLRRTVELAHFYMSENGVCWEFYNLLKAANDIEITNKNLQWQDNTRYSNRQKTKMKLGGFIGDITIQGDLEQYWELLHYAEILHVGKATTFGLGKILVE